MNEGKTIGLFIFVKNAIINTVLLKRKKYYLGNI